MRTVDAVLDHASSTRLLEADLATQRLDFGTHLLDHADQPEGANVRLADVEDLFRRTGLDEFRQHLARQMTRVADLAPQFAVGKCAGSAFAELDVRFRIQIASTPQGPRVFRAFAHPLAALEHDRPQPHLRQQQRREDSAWTEADDERARALFDAVIGRCSPHQAIAHVRRRTKVRIIRMAREHGGLIAQFAIDRVSEHHRPFATCIDRTSKDGN